jgi:hypothetical protein
MTYIRTYFKCVFLKGLFVASLLGLIACSSTPSPELTITNVSIFAESDANENSATAVDLVLIYDLDLMKSIGQLSASKYFAASNQLLLDNPTFLDVWHWELVPGQMVQNFVPPQEKGEMYGAYVFADYLTFGDHRVRVPPSGVVKILLLREDMKNLSMSETPDLRLGKTQSDILCIDPCDQTAMEGNQYKRKKGPTVTDLPCDEPSYHAGPTKNLSSPCKKSRPKQDQAPVCQKPKCQKGCPFRMRSTFGKPLPIVAQPLPSLVSTPCSRNR